MADAGDPVVTAVPEISVVVPMLDAEERVSRLHARLAATLDAFPMSEVLLVDDGSRDDTWRRIVELSAIDPRVVGVRLRENFGQTGALCAGFAHAHGSIVVMMDDDLESDPTGIRGLVAAVQDGADFASGWRVGRRTAGRSVGSRLYNRRLRSWGLPFRDAGCGFNAMRLELAQQISDLGWGVHQHRFKPVVATLTRSIVDVPVEVRPTRESHHHLTGLAASWLDVELTFGRLTERRFVGSTVIAPAAVAAGLMVGATQDRRRGTRSLACGGGALLAMSVAWLAADALRLRRRQERRAASRPAFDVAELAHGGVVLTATDVAPSDRGTPGWSAGAVSAARGGERR